MKLQNGENHRYLYMEEDAMLCQFSVRNYKSIRDEITFDMQAAAISEHTDRIIKDADDQLFLPVSSIYGPNGGGKSNVLEALQTLGTMVLRPVYATKQNGSADYKFNKYPVKPFMFSEEGRNNPTEFVIFFRTGAAEYKYVLHTQDGVVVNESLDRVKLETGRKSALFNRKGDEINLKGVFVKLKISEGLSKNLPLLSYLGITYMDNDVVADVMNWFENGIDFLNYGNPFEELRTAIASSEEIKQLVLDMIKEMDLDIEDFRVEERENGRLEVFTQHIVDGFTEELTLSEESSGTKKLFGLLPFIAKSLVLGTTLVIDELDAKSIRYF